ncbi:hypothetical protein N7478_009716 [Penicillium angulare]|uniref:uncharacterized protein n=1 Tax=Penicillium angulare TaxID=116970 RepID=UPI00253FC6D9|nr:uncharacterized protein N7478_009716 [Penicillium angulare]KAJ5266908.1 hypothetical protein N7478_009716 [Penicillium angulare]
MPLNILVVGAGICGPAFATLLQRANPMIKITILERYESLRTAGQQIDLKTQAPHILRKMGLMEEIQSRCVNETGLEMVDSLNNRTAYFPAASAGERRPGLTSEHEIMRGDMVQVLYDVSVNQDASLKARLGNHGGLHYEFGRTITALNQNSEGVSVTFSDGKERHFDLVVAADGQASRTRRLAFGKEISDASFKSLNIHGAYFSIPRIEGEGSLAQGHLAPGKRMIVTRPSDRPVTGVLMFTMRKSDRLSASYNESQESQKEAFIEIFNDSEWQKDRFIEGLRSSKDFYADEIGQIKMSQLSTGRVVLLGDAGYCPSPFTGLGTNLCLMGAYILAGELARHESDIKMALKSYEDKMRPTIDECQRFSSAGLGLFFPSSRIGVWSMTKLVWAVSKVNGIFPQFSKLDTQEEKVPDYPELNLEG